MEEVDIEMTPARKKKTSSIRVTLDEETLKRIDAMAGERGRQRFIKEAILWRLDQELPPVVFELIRDVEQLQERVEHLEGIRSTSVYIGGMNETVRAQVCRDDLDRNLVAYFLQHEGASTPELAKKFLKDANKRKTIHVRIRKLNDRSKTVLGARILRYEKGEVKGKRDAWWLIEPDLVRE
ncbi:MAG: hypothetical protein ACFFFC_01640 [Candidatus Thorarchaeota archaeon]